MYFSDRSEKVIITSSGEQFASSFLQEGGFSFGGDLVLTLLYKWEEVRVLYFFTDYILLLLLLSVLKCCHRSLIPISSLCQPWVAIAMDHGLAPATTNLCSDLVIGV